MGHHVSSSEQQQRGVLSSLALLVFFWSTRSALGLSTHPPRKRPRAEPYKKRRSLHRGVPALEKGRLDRGVHEVYYQVHGTRSKPMALFLHGGPGAGCVERHAQFFDPKKWRVALVDQRGCGKSTPDAPLEENSTPYLVEDLEALRNHLLGDEPWACVLGGSWGTTLALAYAQAYPTSTRSVLLRAVCAMRTKEIRWLFSPDGGAASLAPQAWRHFAQFAYDYKGVVLAVQEDDQGGAKGILLGEEDTAAAKESDDPDFVLNAYHEALTGDDERARAAASRNWLSWEMAASAGGQASRGPVRVFHGGQHPQKPSGKKTRDASSTTKYSRQALLTCHYSVHRGFFDEGDSVLRQSKVDAIRHIPAIAVQGAADHICPPTTAFELHTKWPELELRLVPGAGHSHYDRDITHELVSATDAILEKIDAAPEFI